MPRIVRVVVLFFKRVSFCSFYKSDFVLRFTFEQHLLKNGSRVLYVLQPRYRPCLRKNHF